MQSATLVIAYLMRKEMLSFKEAIAEVRRHRPKVLPNLGFERQLKDYEKVIRA
jgi:protein-tyrosine phosphatase